MKHFIITFILIIVTSIGVTFLSRCNSERIIQTFKDGDIIYLQNGKQGTIRGKADTHNVYTVEDSEHWRWHYPVDSLLSWNGWEY